jgi:cyclopropane fatty-acyl-phospholipid synthase-like methyltransferase
MKRCDGRVLAAAVWLLGLVLAVAPLHAQDVHKPGGGHQHRFDDPKKWSATFDDPERDKWQMPDRVIAALKLGPKDVVADIGAGTGYMAVRLARHLKAGTVFAVDLEPKMVQHLAERAKANGITNLRTIVATETSPNLPQRVDLVFLLNVYHHISERPGYFKRLQSAMKPGSRVAIVDFRPESPVGAPKHIRVSADQIRSEMTAAGYAAVDVHDFLPYQNFLVFQLPD